MKQKRMAIIMIAIVTSIALLSILNIEVIKIIKKKCVEKNLSMELYINQLITEAVKNENILLSYNNNFLENHFQKFEKNTPLLILRYSKFSCKSCVDFSKQKISEHFNSKNLNNKVLYIVSDYENKESHKDERVIHLRNQTLGIPLEDTNQPFLFVLKNNTVQNIFIPDNSFPFFFDNYLNELIRQYFQESSHE